MSRQTTVTPLHLLSGSSSSSSLQLSSSAVSTEDVAAVSEEPNVGPHPPTQHMTSPLPVQNQIKKLNTRILKLTVALCNLFSSVKLHRDGDGPLVARDYIVW